MKPFVLLAFCFFYRILSGFVCAILTLPPTHLFGCLLRFLLPCPSDHRLISLWSVDNRWTLYFFASHEKPVRSSIRWFRILSWVLPGAGTARKLKNSIRIDIAIADACSTSPISRKNVFVVLKLANEHPPARRVDKKSAGLPLDGQ